MRRSLTIALCTLLGSPALAGEPSEAPVESEQKASSEGREQPDEPAADDAPATTPVPPEVDISANPEEPAAEPARPAAGDSAATPATVSDAPPPNTKEDSSAPAPPPMAVLKGRILERGSGKPIAGARVTSGNHSAVVREDGGFLLPLPAGRRAIVVQNDDHLEFAQVEELWPGDALTVVYRMERWAWGKEVIVYGDKMREEVSRTVLTAEELRLVPGNFGDPIRALQSLPGVARPTTAEGDLVIRGASALNTATTIDLVPVPYLFHFFIGRSVVNPSLLDDVEFYPGGMPSRFGNVTQALVNARTAESEIGLGVHGSVAVDLLDFSANAQGRIGEDLTWEASIRESWMAGIVGLGTRIAARARGNGTSVPGWAAPNYFDYSTRFRYTRGQDVFTFSMFGADDQFELHPPRDLSDPVEPVGSNLPYNPNKPIYANFHRLQVRWDRELENWDQSTWIAAGPDLEGSIVEGVGQLSNGPELGEVRGWIVHARRDDRAILGPRLGALRFGAEGSVRAIRVKDFDEAFTAEDVALTTDGIWSGSTWVEWQREWGKTWISPGMRMSGYRFNGRFAPSGEPRVSVRQPLGKNWTLTGFAGRFSQVPRPDRYAAGIGNPDLGLMTAWQGSVGLETLQPSGLEVNVTLYSTWMENLVEKEQQVVLRREDDHAHTGTNTVFKASRGRATGVDTLVRMRPNRGWFGWAALSVSSTRRFDANGSVRGDFDQPVSLTLVAARELPKDWRISARFRTSSGHPYTPLTGHYLVEEDRWTAVEGEENAARLPAFRQLDLRVDRTWTAKRGRWTLYLDIFNVLNQKNYFLATYDPTFQRLEPQVWMPLLPNLGLEVAY